VWLGWPEPVDIYLGRGIVLLRVGKAAAKSVQLAPSAGSMAEAFNWITSSLEERKTGTVSLRRRKLRVTLSAGLCPAVGFSVPKGVRARSELEAIALAAAHSKLGIATDALVVNVDSGSLGVAGVVPKRVLGDLTSWATSIQGQLDSVRPLWSLATNCSLLRHKGIGGLILAESDAVTFLADTKQSQSAVKTILSGNGLTSPDPVASQEWLESAALSRSQVVQLGFGRSQQLPSKKLPRDWNLHWSVQ
jgi:hypothetical protein